MPQCTNSAQQFLKKKRKEKAGSQKRIFKDQAHALYNKVIFRQKLTRSPKSYINSFKALPMTYPSSIRPHFLKDPPSPNTTYWKPSF
jgi:hypothetical protein